MFSMMKKITAIGLTAVALMFANPASAEDYPKPMNQVMVLSGPVCDYEEQAMSIVNLWIEEGKEAAIARFQELNDPDISPSDRDPGPSCGVVVTPSHIFVRSILFEADIGNRTKVVVLEVVNSQRQSYYLVTEFQTIESGEEANASE